MDKIKSTISDILNENIGGLDRMTPASEIKIKPDPAKSAKIDSISSHDRQDTSNGTWSIFDKDGILLAILRGTGRAVRQAAGKIVGAVSGHKRAWVPEDGNDITDVGDDYDSPNWY